MKIVILVESKKKKVVIIRTKMKVMNSLIILSGQKNLKIKFSKGSKEWCELCTKKKE